MFGLIFRIVILYFIVSYFVGIYNEKKMTQEQLKAEITSKAIQLKTFSDNTLKPFLVQKALELKQGANNQPQVTTQGTTQAVTPVQPLNLTVDSVTQFFNQTRTQAVIAPVLPQKPKQLMQPVGEGFKPFCPIVPEGHMRICQGE